jgi:hypothetical protein
MQHSDQINELAAALAKAQASIQPAVKDKTNPAFRSRYADLSSVWEACREALTSNGLSVVQMPIDAGEGRVALETTLLHTSGQYLSSSVSTRLVKDDPQGVGSALTYLRRYALSAMVGVVADEDDDGNAASRTQPQRQQVDRPRLPAEQLAPASAEASEAEGKFYENTYDLTGGAESWPDVQRWLGTKAPKPTTVEGWRAAYKQVKSAAEARTQPQAA